MDMIALAILQFLTLSTDMRAALANNDPLNFRPAPWTGFARATEYVELIPVAALMSGDGIKIGFAGSQ